MYPHQDDESFFPPIKISPAVFPPGMTAQPSLAAFHTNVSDQRFLVTRAHVFGRIRRVIPRRSVS